MGKFYGHSHLVALKSAEGLLCHRLYASTQTALLLFTDAKVAREWMKKAGNCGYAIGDAQPTLVSSHAPELRVTINPAADDADIRRIMNKREWRNV